MAKGRGFLDVQVPFFEPMWRRVASVVVLVAWTGVELANGAVFWAMIFGAAAAYLGHQFFIAWTGPQGD